MRVSLSRCTFDEARAAASLRSEGELVGVAGTACPSAPRLARYLRTFAPAAALTPHAALARAGRTDARTLAALTAIGDHTQLHALVTRLLGAASWDELLANR